MASHAVIFTLTPLTLMIDHLFTETQTIDFSQIYYTSVSKIFKKETSRIKSDVT